MAARSTETLFVDATQRRQASQLLDALKGGPLQILVPPHASTAPLEITAALSAVLEAMARGETVLIGSLPPELTTTQAASQLGISRPTLMKLIHEGSLPARKVGTHHRIRLDDVREFQRVRLEKQRAAYAELTRLSEHLEDTHPSIE